MNNLKLSQYQASKHIEAETPYIVTMHTDQFIVRNFFCNSYAA